MSNQVTLTQELNRGLNNMAPQFAKALPAHVSVDRFVRVVMTSVNSNPGLLNADRRTLFAAATHAAQLGLLPDGREGAIVTFSGKCQFMPMVAGVMKMVRNSGEISTWTVEAVYENDEFDFQLGDEPFIMHKPKLSNRGGMIAVYSIVTMKDGEKSREVMGIDDVEAIRGRSRSAKSGPWVTDYAEMAKKTVIRRHAKRLPSSSDLDGLVSADDDLFMPEPSREPVPPTQESSPEPQPSEPVGAPEDEKPSRKRASRLDAVAEQAPDMSDTVTDVQMNEPPTMDAPEFESPI